MKRRDRTVTSNVIAAVLFVLCFIEPSSCAAAGFKGMAKELAQAAKRAGVERVAVLPFVSAGGVSSRDGWEISEKLVTQLVRTGKVQTIERSLLRSLMDEQHLGQTGIIDAHMLKTLGRIAAADGIVTGSFETLGRQVVVNARLINVETGVIVAAVEVQVEREWFDPLPGLGEGSAGPLWIPAPELTVEAPPIPDGDFMELHDAPAETSCEHADERIDRLEGQIVDLKARYWALQLRKGVRLSELKVNPGSTISDPALKQIFYERLKYWYGAGEVPPLSAAEVARFVSIDGKAYSIYHDCGV